MVVGNKYHWHTGLDLTARLVQTGQGLRASMNKKGSITGRCTTLNFESISEMRSAGSCDHIRSVGANDLTVIVE